MNAKTVEIESKMPSFTGLATNSATNSAVENKIPAVSGLVTKTDLDTKLQDISKRITSKKTKH